MHYAFRDFESLRDVALHLICETLRNVAVVVFNSAMGRARKDQISDAQKLWKFGWEKEREVRIQSVEEMKGILNALALNHDLTLTKKNKETDAG